MKRSISKAVSVLLCALILLPALSGAIVSAAPAVGVAAYVGDENSTVYKEDYDTVVSEYGKKTDSERFNWSGFAWRGDEVNSRIDIATYNKAYDDVRLVATDLVNEKGDVIDKSNITFTYMHAVELVERWLNVSSNGKHVFDVVTHKSVTDMKANTLYCAWIAIKPPANAKGGTYTTTLSVQTKDEVLATFNYTLTVYDFLQPELDSMVDIWHYPYSIQRIYSGLSLEEYWDKEKGDPVSIERMFNERLQDKYLPAFHSELELYAKAGGDTIYAQVRDSSSTEVDPRPSMVKWTLKTDGSLSFDYSEFDKWVELNFEHGIDGQIKCYTPGVFNNPLIYYDERKGTFEQRDDKTGGLLWKRFWGAFVEDFMVHLDEKGWFDITYLAMDETDKYISQGVIDLVNAHPYKDGRTLKVALAAASFHTAPVYDEIDDLSFAYGMCGQEMLDYIAKRKEQGLITTIYPCGPQGNSLINDPNQSAMSAHDCYAAGADGFLRWALNKYGDDPLVHTDNGAGHYICAGDLYLFYPDFPDGNMQAQTSPRYDKLCEGLRDIEKAEYLEQMLPELAAEIHSDFIMAKGSVAFRNVIDKYSAILAGGTAPSLTFEKEEYILSDGNTVKVIFDEQGERVYDNQADRDYLDDQAMTYSDGWVSEGQYFNMFFMSTNHYSDKANISYEYTFNGNGIKLVGTQSPSSDNANVYVDGEKVGTTNQGGGNNGRFTTIFEIEGLPSGEHHIKVESTRSGIKQLDLAIVKRNAPIEYISGNEDVFTVDEDGVITATGAGSATLTVRSGNVSGTVAVTVAPNAAELKGLYDGIKNKDLSGYDSKTVEDYTAILEEVKAVVDNPESSDDDRGVAFGKLYEASALLISRVTPLTGPVKSTYTVGERVSDVGVTLKVEYKNGESDMAKWSDITTDASAIVTYLAGEYTLTADCLGHKAEYTITVNDTADSAAIFRDVKSGQWYESAVNYAVGHGLFNGMSANKFEPNTPMSRAMLVTVLYRMEGSPAADGIENPFKDVKAKDWFCAPVLWAAENGIVGGVGAGKFAPNNDLTREQLATILYRYAEGRGLDVSAKADLTKYPDAAKVSSWAEDAYSWANAQGLIGGNNIGGVAHLDPAGKATRAQVATILMRFLDNLA